LLLFSLSKLKNESRNNDKPVCKKGYVSKFRSFSTKKGSVIVFDKNTLYFMADLTVLI